MTHRIIAGFAALTVIAFGTLGPVGSAGAAKPDGPTVSNSNELNGLELNALLDNGTKINGATINALSAERDASGQPQLRGFTIVGVVLAGE